MLTVPTRFNFVTDTFEKWSSDRLCMRWIDDAGADRPISWKEMSENANRLVNVLRAHGVTKGDRVFIQVGRLPEWWETMLACLKMGAIAMPGTVMLTSKDIGYRMELSEPVAVVTEASIAPRFDEVRHKARSVKAYLAIGGRPPGWLDLRAERDAAPVDARPEPTLATIPSILYFTSGTTGFAKMVLHTQASYGLGHVIDRRYWLDLRPSDLHWNISDTGWAKAAWSSSLRPVHHGRGAARPQSGRRVQRPARAGHPRAVPDHHLLRRRRRSSARSCSRTSGSWTLSEPAAAASRAGEPLNPEVIETWKAATGLDIRDGYGQTETCCLVGNFPGARGQARLDGQAVAGLRRRHHRRRREAGRRRQGGRHRRADRARRGRSACSASTGRTPRRTGASVRGDWYITGDRGVMDEDGYFWFVGRADDVIISAGYRIGPFEVESALLEHPAVAESAVVASPDEHARGDRQGLRRPQARRRAPPEALAAELQEHCKKVTAPYKYPREIEFVTELPKTVSGKIRRVELRNREWGRPIPASNERE